jgi:hypothetical protein
MIKALEDDGVEEDAAMATWGAEAPAITDVEEPEAEVPGAILPDSVSRFSRFRSARISEACW